MDRLLVWLIAGSIVVSLAAVAWIVVDDLWMSEWDPMRHARRD